MRSWRVRLPLYAAGLATGGAFGVLFGVGSIILFPILYGILGFLGGLITALPYNLIARFVGGIELELEQRSIRVY